MNILAIIENNPGGELRATAQLFDAVQQEGANVQVESLQPLKRTALLPFVFWILRSTYSAFKMCWTHRETHLVYSTTYVGVLGCVLARSFTKQRVAYHYHGSRLPDPANPSLSGRKRLIQSFKRSLVLRLHSICLSRADLFCVPTEQTSVELRKDFPGLQFRKMQVIPNGVNTTTFQPLTEQEQSELRKKFHIPKASFVCLIISRMNQEKHILETIDFIESIQAHSRRQVLIVLAYPESGSDQKYVEDVQRRLLKFEVPHIALADYPHLEHLYQISDCVISCSEREVFSLALLEAASCGIPYFARPNGSTEKFLADIDTDLILPSSDQQAARQVLAGTHRRKLLEKLRAFAASHSWQASAVLLQRSLSELR